MDGALRVRDGQPITLTAPSRNSAGYQHLLAAVEAAGRQPRQGDRGDRRQPVQSQPLLDPYLAGRPPCIRQVFIPKGAYWLNLAEGWWRLFRRAALAGQSFATPEEITLTTEVATAQLNARGRPWVWGRPPPSARYRRRVLTYRI